MSFTEIADLLLELRLSSPQWSTGALPTDALEQVKRSVDLAISVDLDEAIAKKRVAYAKVSALVYPASRAEAKMLWDSGCTVILQSLNSSPGLMNSLCAAVEVSTSQRTSCSIYVSGEYAESFEMHTDDWDVLAIVIAGEKMFWLEEAKGVAEVNVREGEILYIPRGMRHRAMTSKGSTHISVNILQYPARSPLSFDEY